MQQSSTSVAAKKANGQGSVYPKYKKVVDKKSQRYVGAIYDITGKRRKKTFRLKKDAENWVAEQRIIRERGGTSYAVDPKESIENFLNNWVSNRYFNSPETERNYRGAIKTRIVPYIGSVPASKVTTRTLEQLIKTLRDKGYSKGSVMSVFNVLHGAFKDAVRCGDLPINPMTKVSRPKINATRILPVPQEDFVRIYGAAKSQPYWLALLEIAGIMGPRKGEYLALRWSDVNLENRVITLRSGVQREGGVGLVIGDRKNHDSHHFPISSKQVQILVAYREFQKSNKTQWSQDLDLLFPNSQGGIMDPRNFNRSWKKFLEVHGLPYYSPHRLRKTAHTNISQIADPGTLKSLSGHKSVTTTLSYYVMPGEESARAAVEKLDKFRGDEQIIDFQVAKATREKQMTTKNHESSGKNYA